MAPTGLALNTATNELFDPGSVPAGAPKTVRIYEDEGLFDELSAKLSALGYKAVDGSAGMPPQDCTAALVSASLDGCIELSKRLATRCRVVFFGDERGFAFRLEAARSGAEAVLGLPLDMVELGAWLEDFEGVDEQTRSILIVDDDELIATSYAMALEEAGMRAHIVTDPFLAFDTISRVSPDLVLLDMHMPGVDGLEIAQIIRQSRQNLSLPIVFLSAEQDTRLQYRARKIGGDDFITKPISLDRLAAAVSLRADRAVALRQVMERDSLTGLLNHARFKDRVALEVERSKRTKAPLSVCLIDIDHFKRVNDTYGHQAGDRVIQTLARSLVGSLRRIDVVARYGGEEFGILLLDAPEAAAAAVVDKIRMQFSEFKFGSEDQGFSVTLSAGVAGSVEGADADMLISMADDALYKAKRTGRNRIVVA